MSGSRLIGIRIDIETKSSTDIKKGAYRYAEDPDFEVLICAYSPLRREPSGKIRPMKPITLDLYDQRSVDRFADVLLNPDLEKHAYNANFERISLSRWMGMGDGEYLDPLNWRCSAVRANVAGVFGTLDEVARHVRSPIKKDAAGKALIKFFSTPIPARSKHTCGCVGFHSPHAHPEEFARYESYCRQDVTTEYMVARALPDPSPAVQAQYEADQRINDRGFRHYRKLSEAAVAQVEREKNRLMGELKLLTGLENPNSIPQLKGWLESKGYPMESLDKEHREDALADPLIPEEVAEVLEMKGAASLSSVTKHKAALATRCNDGRIRGSLQFYGAHTGREAGRGIQPQNLPRYEAPKADRLRLLRGEAGEDAPTIAKGTVRASIVPARNNLFVTLDYNAIEARVLAGLAGEKWKEEVFRTDGKIYEATAAQMFSTDYDRLVAGLKACDKCGQADCVHCSLRGRGKVSELALGYAGGAGALVTMGAEAAGIDCGNYKELNAEWKASGSGAKFHEWQKDRHDYPELLRLRDLYRSASEETVRFWKHCAQAWDAASEGRGVRFGANGCLAMIRDGRHNRLILPSGRSIWYRYAQSHADPDRPERIDRRTFVGKGKGVGHMRVDTHGGKLTENVTQAVARDVLFDLILNIESMTAMGWPGKIVLHVHDEVVLETPAKQADQVLADVKGLMSTPPSWGSFLIIKGEGAIMERYAK